MGSNCLWNAVNDKRAFGILMKQSGELNALFDRLTIGGVEPACRFGPRDA